MAMTHAVFMDDILYLITKRWSESDPLPEEKDSLIPEDEDDDLSQFDMSIA